MTQLEQRDDVVFSVFRKGSHLAAGVHWQKCIKAEGEFVLQLTKKSYSLVGRFRDSIYVCNKVVSEQYRRIDKIGSTPNCDQTSPSICLILWLWHGPFKLGEVILGDLVLPLKSVSISISCMVIDFVYFVNPCGIFSSFRLLREIRIANFDAFQSVFKSILKIEETAILKDPDSGGPKSPSSLPLMGVTILQPRPLTCKWNNLNGL